LSETGYRIASAVLMLMLLSILLVFPIYQRLDYLWPPTETYHFEPGNALFISTMVFALVGTVLLVVADRGGLGRTLNKRSWLEFLVIYLMVGMLFLGVVFLSEYLVRHRLGLPEKDMERGFRVLQGWLSQHARPGPRRDQSLFFPTGTPAAEWGNILFFIFGGLSVVIFVMLRLQRRGGRVHSNQGLSWAVLGLIVVGMDTQGAVRSADWGSEVGLWRSTVVEERRSLRGWNNLGKAYVDRRRYDLAAEAFSRAIQLQPGMSETHRNLGMALLGAGDFKGAGNAFEKALELSPGDVSSRLNLANILVLEAERDIDPKGFGKAIEHYLTILEFDPRSAHARHNLAYCYFKLGAIEEANQQVMKALYINPRDPKALELMNRIQKARNTGHRR